MNDVDAMEKAVAALVRTGDHETARFLSGRKLKPIQQFNRDVEYRTTYYLLVELNMAGRAAYEPLSRLHGLTADAAAHVINGRNAAALKEARRRVNEMSPSEKDEEKRSIMQRLGFQ